MKIPSLLLATLSAVVLSQPTQAVIISQSPTAPSGGNIEISQPLFNGPQGNAQDFSDNNGAPGQSFTPATAFTLSAVTVKGVGNSGNNVEGGTFTITISQVNGGTLTNLVQETGSAAVATPANNANYFTLTLAAPVALTAGTQYAYSIYSSGGFFGFTKSATDAYAGGAAIQQGTTGRQAANNAAITGTQTVDRTFFIQSVPEPGAIVSLLGGAGLLLGFARRRG